MINQYLWNINTDRIVIPWSGGVDSTNIILKVIDFYESDEDIRNKNVNIIFVSVDMLTKQSVEEKKARDLILEYIKTNYNFNVIHHEFTKKNFAYGLTGDTLMQPFWWLTTLSSHYGNATFLFGYHKGDDFWMKLDKFMNLHESIKAYQGSKCSSVVSFPLAHMYKDDIFNELPEDIKQIVSFCENPKNGSPCKECGSCKTHYRFIKS